MKWTPHKTHCVHLCGASITSGGVYPTENALVAQWIECLAPARHCLSPRGEMDITFGFGPKVLGSSPDGGNGYGRRVGPGGCGFDSCRAHFLRETWSCRFALNQNEVRFRAAMHPYGAWRFLPRAKNLYCAVSSACPTPIICQSRH